MNAYAWIVLGALLVEQGLRVTAGLLNRRALEGELPEELQEVYDLRKFERTREYHREGLHFSLVRSSVILAVVLVFWFLGGFAALDGWVRELGLGPVGTGIVFIGLLALARWLLALPFALHDTFVIEERYGFNRTSPGTFAMDRLKVLGLSVALGGPILGLLLFLLERAGSLAWLWAWLLVSAVLLAVQVAAPRWILPLFLKFRPLEEGELRRRLLEYAESVDFPLQNVFVVDGSRRSGRGNAFFTGAGRARRVALFDTLIEQHDPEELTAVVAHEVGHYKLGHLLQGTLLGILHFGALLVLLQIFLRSPGLHAAFSVPQPAAHTGLVFFGLLYRPIELVLSLGVLWLSRHRELQADRFARRTLGTAEPLVRALSRMAAEGLEDPTPHPFSVALQDSHPPTLQRIRALRGADRSDHAA